MKVVVSIKQTPSTTAVLVVDGGGNVSWDDPGGKPNILNPWDEYTVEEGVRLKENHGATDVIALTVGNEESQAALKTCLAMGCTEAILVSDPALQGLDSLGTARTIAAAINKAEDVQIVVFGRQAIDGDTGQTPVQVARKLGWTPLTFVSAIKEIGDGKITVERLLDEGKETVTANLPVVVSTVERDQRATLSLAHGHPQSQPRHHPHLDRRRFRHGRRGWQQQCRLVQRVRHPAPRRQRTND